MMNELKEQTLESHRRAERSVNLEARLQSKATYIDFLARLYGFHAPLEERLGKVKGYEEIGLDISRRKKSGWLEHDLRALDWQGDVAALPRCPRLPQTPDLARALGCWYVLEGSTLGGQFICRAVGDRLGLRSNRGVSFFASYGDDNRGPMWKEFGNVINRFSELTPDAKPDVIWAAQETFACFEEWLA